jgi:hypothetical protein
MHAHEIARLRRALGVQCAGATMDNEDMPDVTIEILRNIQRRLDAMDSRFDSLETKIEAGFARVDARFELFEARTAIMEGALVHLSGRQHVAERQIETATARHDRELDEIRARLVRLEQRDPQPR